MEKNIGNTSSNTPPNYMCSEEETLRKIDQMVEVCNTMDTNIPGVKIGMVLAGGTGAASGMMQGAMTLGAVLGGLQAMNEVCSEGGEQTGASSKKKNGKSAKKDQRLKKEEETYIE